LKLLRKVHLIGRETLFSINGCPGGSGVPAVQELLVYRFVAATAVSRGKLGGNHKPVVIFFILACRRLMTIKAGHAFAGVFAQLIFVNYGILRAGMAFSALAAGPDKLSAGLLRLNFGTRTVNQKGRQHECKRDDDRDKNRSKRHCPPSNKFECVQH
jgi:hypothetical protein